MKYIRWNKAQRQGMDGVRFPANGILIQTLKGRVGLHLPVCDVLKLLSRNAKAVEAIQNNHYHIANV